MKLLEFTQKYPDEESCIAKLRELRERDVHVCPKCGHKEWYWKGDKLCYECKKCHHRESIRKGTVMENSKLPFRYWFVTMHLLTATKNTFSALELQRQLGHKRYQPVWEMLHKLRSVILINNRMENETTFIRIYPLLSDIELADYYRVEVDSIQKRAKELGLKKDPSLTKYAFKEEEEEEEEANKKMMNQPPTNKSGARKKIKPVWGTVQRNKLDELNNKRKELEAKILKSEKFDERTYEEWKVINLKCQGLEYILK